MTRSHSSVCFRTCTQNISELTLNYFLSLANFAASQQFPLPRWLINKWMSRNLGAYCCYPLTWWNWPFNPALHLLFLHHFLIHHYLASFIASCKEFCQWPREVRINYASCSSLLTYSRSSRRLAQQYFPLQELCWLAPIGHGLPSVLLLCFKLLFQLIHSVHP